MCLLKSLSALPDLHLQLFYYIIARMLKIILSAILSSLRSHRALALETLALSHQLIKSESMVGGLRHGYYRQAA